MSFILLGLLETAKEALLDHAKSMPDVGMAEEEDFAIWGKKRAWVPFGLRYVSDSVFLLVPIVGPRRIMSVYILNMYSENVGLCMNGKRFEIMYEIVRNEI